jgi:hypothetical protein
MPLQIHAGAPTLFVRRQAYERSGLVRAALDERLGLTDNEFRVEGDVVEIGLVFYDDFFELNGAWPEWLSVFAGSVGEPGRSKPSQPHS